MQISDDICLGAYLSESSLCRLGGWQVEIRAGDKADTVHTVNSRRTLGAHRAAVAGRTGCSSLAYWTHRALQSGRADQGANVHGAELPTDRVHHDGVGGVRHSDAADAGNKNVGMGAGSADPNGVVIPIYAHVANVNVVAASVQVYAGVNPQRGILDAVCVVRQCPIAVGSVIRTGRVQKKSPFAVGRISRAGRIVVERYHSISRVARPGRVVIERILAVGRVVFTVRVETERGIAISRVARSGRVEKERFGAAGCVVISSRVGNERGMALAGVAKTGQVVNERRVTVAGVVNARHQVVPGIGPKLILCVRCTG